MTRIFRFEEYTCTSNDLKIGIVPEFLPEESNPAAGIYTFSYTIQIENCGEKKVQLLNRHWKIFVGDQQIEDIKGQGVLGKQPVIEPRQAFQYSSSVVIDHPVGKMRGAFTFVDEKDNFFDVFLPEFDLVYADQTKIH